MKLPEWKMPRLSREARVAIAVAILIAFAAIAFEWGAHFTGGVLILLAIALAAAFYLLIVRPARIPSAAVLSFRLSDGLREDAPRSPLEQLRSRGAPTLHHLRRALQAAANDPSIAMVLVEILSPGLGLAAAQELHDLLRGITAAGKRVVAVVSGDNLTINDYLLACGAGEIVVNPDSCIMMLGVAAGGVFLKQALSNAGIEAQTLQWKEYKGAAETFTRESMSPQLRESLEALIGDWRAMLCEQIAAARKLAAEKISELIGAGFLSVAAATEAGLIDRAGYLDDLRDELDPEGEHEERFVGLNRYLRHLAYRRSHQYPAKLALIHGLGPVIAGEPPMAGEFISGERLAEDIRRAARDEQVRAIVFRVNSPGGSAVGSDLVWRAVADARKRGKPVVVSMGDVAGSGGYYVAMGADAIVAEPATVTGSIGVVYTKFSVPALLQRLGIAIESAKSDAISDALSAARPMNEHELAQVNQLMGQLYANFVGKVAEGRKLAAEQAEQLARGRIWSGRAAHAQGLVDELGGLSRAVEIAREKAGLTSGEPSDLMLYPTPGLIASMSLKFARTESSHIGELAAQMVGLPSAWAPALIHLMTRGGALHLASFFPVKQ